MDNDLILAYLAVLVSYLVFGIGLLPLADDRPTHIKPISDRYDHLSQKIKKWGVIYFLLIQIISLVLYLFDVNALFGWQSFDVVRQFFIRYYNQLSAGMIVVSSCLMIWLYHQTIFQGKDYKKLIERIRGNKKISFEQKMRDLGRIGFFAESIDIKLEVLDAIRKIVGKGEPWLTAKDEWKEHDHLLKATAQILDVINSTLDNSEEDQDKLLERVLQIITELMTKLSVANNQTPDQYHTALFLGQAFKDLGSEALRHTPSWNVKRTKTILMESTGKMPSGQQAEMLYRFGLAAQEGKHREEALELLTKLRDDEVPTWDIYWVGLLARLADGHEVGYQWAAKKVAAQENITPSIIAQAQNAFLALDVETAAAIEKMRAFLPALSV